MLTLIMTIFGGVAVAALFAGATFIIAATLGRLSESADRAGGEREVNPPDQSN